LIEVEISCACVMPAAPQACGWPGVPRLPLVPVPVPLFVPVPVLVPVPVPVWVPVPVPVEVPVGVLASALLSCAFLLAPPVKPAELQPTRRTRTPTHDLSKGHLETQKAIIDGRLIGRTRPNLEASAKRGKIPRSLKPEDASADRASFNHPK